MTAARGAAPRRGRRFARSRRSRPPERRFARRAHAHSGRASRSPQSWRGQRPTRPRSPCRSSPSWPDVRGPRQIAALSRHRSRAPVFHRVHSQDGAIPSPDTNAPRLEGVGARRTGILSLRAVVAVNDPYAGDRGAVRRQGHFFTLSHRCRAPPPVPSRHPIRPGRGGRDVGSHGRPGWRSRESRRSAARRGPAEPSEARRADTSETAPRGVRNLRVAEERRQFEHLGLYAATL